MSTAPQSTLAGDFYGSPPQADADAVPRKFIRTTDALGAYWREEVQSAGGAAGSSHTTVFPGVGTTFNIGGNATVNPAAGTTWNVAGNTTAVITSASQIQTEPIAGAVFPVSGQTTAIISTLSKIKAEIDPLTTASTIRAELTNQSTDFTQTNFSSNVTLTGGVTTALISSASKIGSTVASSFALAISSNAGTTSLVTSGTGRVRVLSYDLQHIDTGSTVVNLLRFLSSATTIAAPEWLLGQREGVVKEAPAGAYLFQTATGDALNLSLSTNVKAMAHVVFIRTVA